MTRPTFLVLFVLAGCTSVALTSGSPQSASVSVDGGSQLDLPPPVLTGAIACGSQTCGPNQFCFHDCCDSPINHCFAAPSGGCKNAGAAVPSCNGVEHGCLCDESDPSKCPAPPSCDHATEPFCITVTTSSFQDCNFPMEGGNPCPATGGECDPNNRVISCACGS